MRIDTASTLERLNKHAFEFNFPVLDNAYVDLACTKMSVFCDQSKWILAFEVVGFTNNNGEFENYLYAYGNCLAKEGLILADVVMSEVPASPLIDPPTQAWVADWSDWRVVVRNELYHFRPSKTDYDLCGIPVEDEDGPGSLPEVAVLRYYLATEGSSTLFMTRDELLGHLEGCSDMELLLETLEWEHPNVAAGGRPSDSASIRSVVEAVQECSPWLFTAGQVNTHWKDWVAQED